MNYLTESSQTPCDGDTVISSILLMRKLRTREKSRDFTRDPGLAFESICSMRPWASTRTLISLSLSLSSEKWLIIPHQSNEESDSIYLTGLSWGLNNMVWYASLSSWHQSKLSINVRHCGCCGKTFYDMDTHLSSLVSLQALLLPSLNSSPFPFPRAFPRLLCFYCPVCWTVQSHLPPLLHLADSYPYDSPEESITFSRKLSLISTFWVRCSPLSSNTILCFPLSMLFVKLQLSKFDLSPLLNLWTLEIRF